MGTSAATIRSYRDLKVWRVSMNLVTHVNQVSSAFPRHETYGLTSQVRRAAVSISSNIAEGHGREHLGDYLYHLSVANGSLMELETQVLIAGRLGYTDQPSIDALMLTAVDRRLPPCGTHSRTQAASASPSPGHLTPGTGHVYSYLSATIGSTFVARRAGTKLASSATATSSSDTTAKLKGSVGVTP